MKPHSYAIYSHNLIIRTLPVTSQTLLVFNAIDFAYQLPGGAGDIPHHGR
ncbi:hypothetical protein JOJ88_005125 [Pantoea cypripedii]|nr:hypothetical protein [Pantoea cypripedii]